MARVPKASTNGSVLVPSKVWDRLTAQERKLVETYLSTGNERVALRQAGYLYADQYRLFHDELIVAAIFSEVTHRIARGACIGQLVLESVAMDGNAPVSARVMAAKSLRDPFLERKLQSQGMDKPLTEHTIEELRALVDTLENQRSKDAKLVALTPASAPISDDPLDLLG